jgi:iron complex outermembrane receptor protein
LDPTIDQYVNNQNTTTMRAKLLALPTNSFTVELALDWMKDTTGSDYYTSGDPTIGGTFLDPARGTFEHNVVYASETPLNDTLSGGAALTLNDRLDDHLNLKSVTAFRAFEMDPTGYNNDGAPALPFGTLNGVYYPELVTLSNSLIRYHEHQLTEELQVHGSYDQVDFTAGVFYLQELFRLYRANFTTSTATVLVPPVVPEFTDYEQLSQEQLRTKTYAGYAQVDYHPFTDRLTISGGIRYSWEHRDYAIGSSFLNQNGIPTALPAVGAPANLTAQVFATAASDSWDAVTPKGEISYQWTPDIFQYVSVSKGFTAGGFNLRANSPSNALPYNPDTVLTYESGVKTDWLNHHARINLSVYYNKFENLQATVIQPSPLTDVLTNYVGNAGSAHTDGFELETTVIPVVGLLWVNNASYLNTRYDSFPNAGGPGIAATGNPLPNSPKWQFNSTVTYDLPIAVPGTIRIGSSATYQTLSHTDVFSNPLADIPAQGFINAFGSYVTSEGHWNFSLVGRNLANRFAFQQVAYAAASKSDPLGFYLGSDNAPRTFMFNISYHN